MLLTYWPLIFLLSAIYMIVYLFANFKNQVGTKISINHATSWLVELCHFCLCHESWVRVEAGEMWAMNFLAGRLLSLLSGSGRGSSSTPHHHQLVMELVNNPHSNFVFSVWGISGMHSLSEPLWTIKSFLNGTFFLNQCS